MDRAAEIHRAAFDERLPWLAGLHTPDEDRAFYRAHVDRDCRLWGGFDPGLVGFIALRRGWIEQLYVLPGHQGRGLGSLLLTHARRRRRRLRLWTFQRNHGARAVYERHGFAVVAMTDGSTNDEKEPDMLYEWRR